MLRKLVILTCFILMFGTVHSQECYPNGLSLLSQSAVDSFPLKYPGLVDVEGTFTICGEDITDLDSLIQIRSIGRNLNIRNTSLSDLSGLDSLESIAIHLAIYANPLLEEITAVSNLVSVGQSIYISDNPVLSSIEGLRNISLADLNYVYLADCAMLSDCAVDNLCGHLASYGEYLIGRNSTGCNNREEIIDACALPDDNDPRSACYYTGFEEWTDNLPMPVGWDGPIDMHDGLYNIERSPALVEGDYSLTLRSNIPFFEGNLDTRIELPLEGENDLIDISFSYKCMGEGVCSISLGEQTNGNAGHFRRTIWRAIAGDSTLWTAELQNIRVSDNFDHFKFVELQASPIWTALGSYGVSEFMIDDFTITKKDSTTSIGRLIEENIVIYPNPVTSLMYIESPATFDRLVVYNSVGQLLAEFEYDSQIDMSHLQNGAYILCLIGKQRKEYKAFIKL